MLALLILAQTVSATPSATAPPEDGPPPPSIVERIDEPPPTPAAVSPPTPTPATPLPTAMPIVAPAPTAPLPTAVPVLPPTPAATSAKPVPSPARVSAAPPPPASTTKQPSTRERSFGVHVSSFRRRATAEADARRLGAELSLPARVLEADLGAKGVWYRVVVGEAGSPAEADALRSRLTEKGIRDTIVVSFGGEQRVR